MHPNPTHPTPTGFTGYVSGHRFGLTMLACALVFAVMMAAVYSSIGFSPIWASHAVPGAP